MTRKPQFYLPIILVIIALGLASRISASHLPNWYIVYAGDFLWACLVYFLYCLFFKLPPKHALFISLATAYAIEISQLFQPAWLEALRDIKIFALVLGHGFLWSDLLAYTMGIGLSALIDQRVISRLGKRAEL